MPAELDRAVCRVRITAVCDHCNYKVQGSLHSIYHHLEVAGIFHTRTDMTDECVCQEGGCGYSRTPAKVFHFLKLFWELSILSYCVFFFSFFFYTCNDHVHLPKIVCNVTGCGKKRKSSKSQPYSPWTLSKQLSCESRVLTPPFIFTTHAHMWWALEHAGVWGPQMSQLPIQSPKTWNLFPIDP